MKVLKIKIKRNSHYLDEESLFGMSNLPPKGIYRHANNEEEEEGGPIYEAHFGVSVTERSASLHSITEPQTSYYLYHFADEELRSRKMN